MSNRHALLIGVPRYDHDEFNAPRLDAAVRCDIDAMRAALKQSDYTITECGTTGSSDLASLNRINQKIEEACASAPIGGVLLVYFSGHGLSEAGTDYLVPSDAYMPGSNQSGGRPSLRSLVKVIPPDEVLRDCRASLVVFFVDACRNESDIESSAKQAVEPGGQIPFLAGGGHFVLVMGCGAGQVCQYDETGSVFTRALAGAIDSGNSARTLEEVVTRVTEGMGRRSRQQAQGGAQTPAVRYPEMLRLAGQVPVCDGDELTDAWRRAVADSSLIRLCDDPDRVYSVVAECAGRCRSTAKYLADRTGLTDPWTDPGYPARVLNKTELLLRNARLLGGPAAVTGNAAVGTTTVDNAMARNAALGNAVAGNPATCTDTAQPQEPSSGGLRSGEAALLLTAPFLREAAIAVGIREAAGVDPALLTRAYIAGARGDLELTHEMHQHLVHRVEGLRKRGEEGAEAAAKASDQLAMWLVHRWLADRVTLWREAGVTVVCEAAADLVTDCRDSADTGELPQLVQAMLLAIGADPDDARLCNRLSLPYVSDRWRLAAAVLWLAGIMAADLRRLPPVVADLVGTGMELPLIDVQTAAGSRAEWVPMADGALDLRLVCDHPALHDAFEDIVRRAADAARTVREDLGLPAGLGEKLPHGFTATRTGLRPSTRQDDTSAYQVPLARFQIAEEKVRELLMGRQLYGDPALAIRELYQNALDACRWRWTRQEYRRRAHDEPVDWIGRITFTQGTDAGRPYIECTDNGVGMDLGTLEHVFGNAGERFVYRQEFRTEQAAWAALEPPLRLISNSQFGVGVFSYFMLADEVVVRTRHHGANGVPDPDAHEVRIASSGSLFQIQPTQGLPNGGTSVRLYLGGEADEISVLRTLRELLWISEFRIEVSEGEDREVWEPGELRYTEGTVPPRRCGKDLWWVSGEGGLAADGIRTGEKRSGLVINLRDERRPQLTVDRRRLEGWDKDWVRQTIEESLPELMKWDGFTLSWLWQVAISAPVVAQQIFEYAVAAGHRIKVGTAREQSSTVALGMVGCMPEDQYGINQGIYSGDWMRNWRIGIWRNIASASASASSRTWWITPPEEVIGFPVPDPIDSALLGRIRSHYADEMWSRDAIMKGLADREFTVGTLLRRLRRYAITGLNIAESRYVPASEKLVEDKDEELLRALVLWARPGEPPERGSVGPLLYSSSMLRMPLGEVLRRAARLAPENWDAPSFDLGELRHHTCTRAEASLLSRDFTNYAPHWVSDALPPDHLAKASSNLGQPLADVLGICDRLAPLGVTVAMRAAYPENVEAAELQALSFADAPGYRLSPMQLVLVAGGVQMSVGAARTKLERLERNGLIDLPEIHGDPAFRPDESHISFIQQYLSRASRRGGYRDRAVHKRPLLAILLQIVGRSGWEEKKTASDLIQFIGHDASLTGAELAEAAYRLRVSLAEVVQKFSQVSPSVSLPYVELDFASVTVEDGIYAALLRKDDGDIEWDAAPGSIVDAARYLREPLGDLLDRLDPFRHLGAPIPTYDDAVKESLNRVELDKYDVEMLCEFDEFGDLVDLRTIAPLQLVRIAGRLGWTLAHAHWRMVRLVPIGVELQYPADANLPDEIVYWYDLLVLTKYFDGQEPAISGRIDWPYLQNAAVEIFDCPPGEVSEKAVFLRDRLRIYAPLFHIDVLEEPPSAEPAVG